MTTMIRLEIDGQMVEVPRGSTVLDAARAAGCDIPALCHCEQVGPLTSCMMCVVKDADSGDTLLACATVARDRMRVITGDEEVHALRRDTLQLLLAEHAGDCEGPCARACPAGLNVPAMLRRIKAEDYPGALAIARAQILFPAVLGRICAAPCEKVCRRGQYDKSVSIRNSHGALAEQHPGAALPTPAPPSGKTVAVLGAGLAGLAAAHGCALSGHACTVYEKRNVLAPALRGQVPDTILDAEFAPLRDWGVAFHVSLEVALTAGAATDISLPALLAQYDAVIFATKDPLNLEAPTLFIAREESQPIRAVATGKRAALEVDAAFLGLPFNGRRMFNSRLGRLAEDELKPYAVERLTDSGGDPGEGLQEQAGRCLSCDCLKPRSCKLRRYADAYGVTLSGRQDLPRPKVVPVERHGPVMYDSGKCIKCGICIAITEMHGIKARMTFSGRGIHTRVRGALDAALAEALGPVAEACARACPTAALALEDTGDTARTEPA